MGISNIRMLSPFYDVTKWTIGIKMRYILIKKETSITSFGSLTLILVLRDRLSAIVQNWMLIVSFLLVSAENWQTGLIWVPHERIRLYGAGLIHYMLVHWIQLTHQTMFTHKTVLIHWILEIVGLWSIQLWLVSVKTYCFPLFFISQIDVCIL